MLEVIKSAHSSIWASTSFGEIYSEPSQTTIGLKQGNPLSTTLFNICINDLPTFLENPYFSEKLALAKHPIDYPPFDEDLAITAVSEKELKNEINFLEICCKQWDLNIHYNETKVSFMTFNK